MLTISLLYCRLGVQQEASDTIFGAEATRTHKGERLLKQKRPTIKMLSKTAPHMHAVKSPSIYSISTLKIFFARLRSGSSAQGCSTDKALEEHTF